ncbi:MAG: single-stranded DNA-binding protein [Saprospiraceae bacterium]
MISTLKNSVHLIGNVGKDVDMITFESGMHKATVSLATNSVYVNNQGERVKQTDWHSLVAWGKVAELLKTYVKKGSDLAVQGKITYRNYTDKNGIVKYVTEIVVVDFYTLNKNQSQKEGQTEDVIEVEQEALPF